MQEIDALIERYETALHDQADAAQRLSEVKSELIAYMEAKKRKNLSADHGDSVAKVTYVKQSRVNIDEKGLRKALTAKVFDRYTDKVLNRKKMEQAMDDGEVDPDVVSKYLTVNESAPFIKYSLSQKEEL